jgi:hypothetical protein
MSVTDINGKIITIEDLDGAITQTDRFRSMTCPNDSVDSEFLRETNAYWEHLYQELKKLKK